MSLRLLLLIAVLWFVVGLLGALRKRAGERFAVWLLPASQAATFRFAHIVAKAASAIAPVRYRPIVSHVFVVGTEYPVARIDIPVTIAGEPRFLTGTFDDGEPWAAIPTVPEGSYIRFLGRGEEHGFANPRLHPAPWSTPDAAIAELEADLAAEAWVAQPVRLVLPLLVEALLIRWQNLAARVVVARACWAVKHGNDRQCRNAVVRISKRDIRI